jgi:hypothetical protein
MTTLVSNLTNAIQKKGSNRIVQCLEAWKPESLDQSRIGYHSAVTLGARTICHAILYAAAKQAAHHSILGYL